jgi:hypothetical protein
LQTAVADVDALPCMRRLLQQRSAAVLAEHAFDNGKDADERGVASAPAKAPASGCDTTTSHDVRANDNDLAVGAASVSFAGFANL